MARRRLALALVPFALVALAVALWPRPLPAGPEPTPEPVAVVAPQAPAPVAPASAPEAPPVPEPTLDALRVLSVEGKVQRRGGDLRWAQVYVGQELRADEAIRTAPSSRAVLGLGEGGRVEVAPRSEFSVREISRTVARVRLEQGRMAAALPGGEVPLRVETSGSEALAESSEGSFVVVSNGHGQLAVAATQGSVRLSVGAASVVVHEGQQSEAATGGAPSAPHAIPNSLFLKVVRPGASVRREREARVRGETAPGALVSINGQRVASGLDGHFQVQVPLKDGRNTLVVEAEDAFGKTKRVALPPIQVKTKVRGVRAQVKWGEEDGP
ncbi:MAG TPA: FecR domain-containing protein [Myxococcus sp.]|nr:FecR domain-containing protein [Myxococcus sp.]